MKSVCVVASGLCLRSTATRGYHNWSFWVAATGPIAATLVATTAGSGVARSAWKSAKSLSKLAKLAVFSQLTVSLAARWQQHNVNGDSLCEWQPLIFDPTNLTFFNPLPKKIVTGDYVSNPYPYTKFGAYQMR